MDAMLDNILQEGYLGDVSQRPMTELHSLRLDCQSVETQLSYLRRLVQGRHDIVTGELSRRRSGGDPDDLSALVDRLPEILGDRIHSPGMGRLPQTMQPGNVSGRLVDRLESIVSEGHLMTFFELTDDQLETIAGQLESLEHDVSDLRRAMFDRIDALQAELTRRYRDGEASVEELLQER
jgi:hypothetical protein